MTFSVVQTAATITEDLTLRAYGATETSPGEPWMLTDTGVWRPASMFLVRRFANLLDDNYRASREKDVLRQITASLPALTPPSDETRTEYVCFTNGIVNVFEPERRPVPPSELDLGDWTVQVPWSYSPHHHEVTPPETFATFITEVFPPDAQAFAWELLGYFLTAGNPLHLAFILKGSGANGKSVFLSTLTRILGDHQVSSLSLTAMSKDNSPVLDQLRGKMANIVDDMGAKMVYDTAVFKAITSEAPIQANPKYRDPVRFVTTAKPIFAVNELPHTTDGSDGFLRRFITVPFNAYFPPDKRVMTHRLVSNHMNEVDGIIWLAMQGLQTLMERGKFEVPESFGMVNEEFAETVADAKGWARERTMLSPAGDTKANELWSDYERAWCHGRPEITRAAFYSQLDGLPGVERYRDRSRFTRFRGIMLRTEAQQGAELAAIQRLTGGGNTPALPEG